MTNEGHRAYDFEPIFMQQELAARVRVRVELEGEENASESDEEPAIDIRQDRLDNVNWCQCTNCGVMPTLSECSCCREIHSIRTILANHNDCITDHDDFQTVCWNKAVLRAALIMRNDIRGHDVNVQRELDHKSYRYSAYRMFTYWIHGRLGRGVRKVVPACAVKKIRDKFPDPDGQYVGFVHGEDGEDMEVGEVEAI